MMNKIVLLGGGHAHLQILANLSRFRQLGCHVSLVQPSPYQYYSGMGPGMLSQRYDPTEIRFYTQNIVQKQDCQFLQDKAEKIDPVSRTIGLQSGLDLEYDLLSCNIGSFVPSGIVRTGARDVFPVKPIASLLEARQIVLALVLRKNAYLAVLGGGPAALEIAANLRRLTTDRGHPSARITIFAGDRFLSRFRERLRKKAERVMNRLGIEVVEGHYVKTVDTRLVVLDNNQVFEPDLSLLALGVGTGPLFISSGLPTGPDQGLLVNRYLQSIEYPEIFGGGDCIHFYSQALDKVGVHAVRQGPVLLKNLMAKVKNEKLQPFRPKNKYMLIFNTGDGKGILVRDKLVLSGRWVFKLKNCIDRKFMKRFQRLE